MNNQTFFTKQLENNITITNKNQRVNSDSPDLIRSSLI